MGKLCQLLEISRSGYYAWLRGGKSARKTANQALLRELGALDETHIAPTYGEYLSDTETTYDGYRNPDGSIPEDLLYDAPDTRTVS